MAQSNALILYHIFLFLSKLFRDDFANYCFFLISWKIFLIPIAICIILWYNIFDIGSVTSLDWFLTEKYCEILCVFARLQTAGGMRPHKTLVFLVFFSSSRWKKFQLKSTILCDIAKMKKPCRGAKLLFMRVECGGNSTADSEYTLHEGMFYADYAETVFAVFLNFRFHRFFRLFRALFAIGGHYQIKNQIDVRFPDGHTEIVQGVGRVDRFYRIDRNLVHFVDEGVVHNDRV